MTITRADPAVHQARQSATQHSAAAQRV